MGTLELMKANISEAFITGQANSFAAKRIDMGLCHWGYADRTHWAGILGHYLLIAEGKPYGLEIVRATNNGEYAMIRTSFQNIGEQWISIQEFNALAEKYKIIQ